MRSELYEQMNKDIITRHPFFRRISKTNLRDICELAKTEVYSSGDVILLKGTPADSMFFIVQGHLQILPSLQNADEPHERSQRDNEVGEHPVRLQSPSWFCDLSLFTDLTTLHTIVCRQSCELLRIPKDSFLTAIQRFPKDMRFYKDFAKRVARDGPVVTTCTICWHCQEVGHYQNDCPHLHLHRGFHNPSLGQLIKPLEARFG